MLPTCDDRKRLLAEYQDALRKFSAAVGRLQECDRDARRFADEHLATEMARLHAENTRTMLNLHRDEHGC